MNVRVKFLGGAQSVTGSRFLLDIDGFRLLVDCGLFQGLKELRLRNWDDFPIDVQQIDAVVLTHAHLDHSGYLPRLFKQGYNGPVYCTDATADLLRILLLDSAKLQVEEAAYAKLKGYSKHADPKPLYDVADAERVFPAVKTSFFDKKIRVSDQISIVFRCAGHILGASIVEIFVHGDTSEKKIVFSGDLGRYNDPVLFDPEVIEQADVLFIESTYGTRNNSAVNPMQELADIINETMPQGCVLIPAFAVGRTQLILYYLNELMKRKLIEEVPVYMDSPMAIAATEIYQRNERFHRLGHEEIADNGEYQRFQKHLHVITNQKESVGINGIKKRAIILSASGMLNGGRVLHHLYHRLPRENETLLLVGYQAEGTRGRRILDLEREVKIFGKEVPVRCRVKQIDGLSAHADKTELHRWLNNFKFAPKMTFVVHGETSSAEGFARDITQTYGWNAKAPEYLEAVELFSGI